MSCGCCTLEELADADKAGHLPGSLLLWQRVGSCTYADCCPTWFLAAPITALSTRTQAQHSNVGLHEANALLMPVACRLRKTSRDQCCATSRPGHNRTNATKKSIKRPWRSTGVCPGHSFQSATLCLVRHRIYKAKRCTMPSKVPARQPLKSPRQRAPPDHVSAGSPL